VSSIETIKEYTYGFARGCPGVLGFCILLAGNIYRRFAFIFKIKQSKGSEVSWMLPDHGPAMDLHVENHWTLDSKRDNLSGS